VRELLLADPMRLAGVVVPPKDAPAIATAILDLLKNDEPSGKLLLTAKLHVT